VEPERVRRTFRLFLEPVARSAGIVLKSPSPAVDEKKRDKPGGRDDFELFRFRIEVIALRWIEVL